MEKDNNLEQTCILEGVGEGKPIVDSSPCINCSDCYLPKNMESGKKELYRDACKSINSYGPEYK